jgi:phosphoribosylamine--glycine ligase
MRVLIIGGGGREHAICASLAGSPAVEALFCAPGNIGIEKVARCLPVKANEHAALVELARRERIDLVVVGPEAPLVAGLADLLRADGRAVFGCSRLAAEIEGSKAFAKAFMARHKVPTASFGVFSEVPAAERFIDQATETAPGIRLVVKADGLAAGKGVFLCEDAREAKKVTRLLLEAHRLGEAGRQIVIEEFLNGREASLMAFVHGEEIAVLEPAEDHKAIFDGDLGAMTGGMGAVSPTPVMAERQTEQAVREILTPTARGLLAEERGFSGLLYAGLMITPHGPKVLEFNCRFGDPETQSLLMRIDEDLLALLDGVARGKVPRRVRFKKSAAVCVVMAAPGYPGEPRIGDAVTGLDEAEALPEVAVYHAGTQRRANGQIVTAGGRVVGVTALGDTVEAARSKAYQAVSLVRFEGAQFRRDIGARRSE